MVKESHIGWYLVYTKPRHETVAKINLERQGFDTYLPLLQQHQRIQDFYKMVTKPLFPRYLFICLSSEIDDWSKIHSTRGCVSLVRFGTWPARVPDVLIEYLQREEAARFAQPVTNTPDFKAGDSVRVLDGILVGYEGIVEVKNSQQRITLLLTVTQHHTRRVNLSVNQIEMVD
ncbi:MAG TPA: transcription/translation regulatory transformer protein RfaH [Gammaproteobacteria bacterium]|nr:transcription/translation regulatory transformer protein RfaH [Gammaproteobacteria bacterium]